MAQLRPERGASVLGRRGSADRGRSARRGSRSGLLAAAVEGSKGRRERWGRVGPRHEREREGKGEKGGGGGFDTRGRGWLMKLGP
jgi:hypothetical protein